jgi:hypothetical protein
MNAGMSHLSQGQSLSNRAVDYLAAPAAMPPAGQSALWKYKGIYLQADQRVGQRSDIVSIPVVG